MFHLAGVQLPKLPRLNFSNIASLLHRAGVSFSFSIQQLHKSQVPLRAGHRAPRHPTTPICSAFTPPADPTSSTRELRLVKTGATPDGKPQHGGTTVSTMNAPHRRILAKHQDTSTSRFSWFINVWMVQQAQSQNRNPAGPEKHLLVEHTTREKSVSSLGSRRSVLTCSQLFVAILNLFQLLHCYSAGSCTLSSAYSNTKHLLRLVSENAASQQHFTTPDWQRSRKHINRPRSATPSLHNTFDSISKHKSALIRSFNSSTTHSNINNQHIRADSEWHESKEFQNPKNSRYCD